MIPNIWSKRPDYWVNVSAPQVLKVRPLVLKRSPALIDSPAIQRNSALAQLFQPTDCYRDTRPDLGPDGQALTLTVPQLSRMIRSNGNTSETKCWFR
jgi:hypothetical protein